jgi:RIO-like serine/threonine protein kinase
VRLDVHRRQTYSRGDTVKADKYTPKRLFQRDVRYVIPMFQRPYVWNKEKQWDRLASAATVTVVCAVEQRARRTER